ncbi:MAG TPA: hypothetical protein VFO77_15355, partial [Actinoplanes sp.]|nr:hypothetical protein [Actinoplanes sp.]
AGAVPLSRAVAQAAAQSSTSAGPGVAGPAEPPLHGPGEPDTITAAGRGGQRRSRAGPVRRRRGRAGRSAGVVGGAR